MLLNQNEDWIDVYQKTLEAQIENKRHFLKESKSAISKIKEDHPKKQKIDLEKWQEFLNKPLMLPEKSDPIGLSLANTSLNTRFDSSKQWITQMESNISQLQDMVMHQDNINKDLAGLIGLMKEKASIGDVRPQNKPSKYLQEDNKNLWWSLESFVKSNLYGSDVILTEQEFEEVMTLVKRLVYNDISLTFKDFQSSSMTRTLYRLLLRTNLIEIDQNDGDTCYIKLINFANTDIV